MNRDTELIDENEKLKREIEMDENDDESEYESQNLENVKNKNNGPSNKPEELRKE